MTAKPFASLQAVMDWIPLRPICKADDANAAAKKVNIALMVVMKKNVKPADTPDSVHETKPESLALRDRH